MEYVSVIILLLISIVIVFLIATKDKDAKKIKRMFERMQESSPNQAVRISAIKHEFAIYIKEKLGDDGVKSLQDNLKVVHLSCKVPLDFSTTKLDEMSISEFNALNDYIYNFALFMFLMAAMVFKPHMTLNEFQLTIKETLDSQQFKEMLMPKGRTPYRGRGFY
jgi:hypothetical protein